MEKKKQSILFLALAILSLALIAMAYFWARGSFGVKGERERARVENQGKLWVVTESLARDPQGFQAAQDLAEDLRGDEAGAFTRHAVLGEDPQGNPAPLREFLLDLGDDPETEGVVVAGSPPGLTAAVAELRERRPDILLVVVNSADDPGPLARVTDLAVAPDLAAEAYFGAQVAKSLGAEKLVALGPAPPAGSAEAKKLAVLKEALADARVSFREERLDAPASQESVALELGLKFPGYLAEFGPKTIYYPLSPDLAPSLLREVATTGSFFLGMERETAFKAYPEALGEGRGERQRESWASVDQTLQNLGAGGRVAFPGHYLEYDLVYASTMAAKMTLAQAEEFLDSDPASPQEELTVAMFLRESLMALAKNGDGNYLLAPYADPVTGRVTKGYYLAADDYCLVGRGPMELNELSPLAKYYQASFREKDPQSRDAFHIGVFTGTIEQGGDDLRGALEMARRWGAVADGGMVDHRIYGDDFFDFPDRIAREILSFADDPLMKVIVVNQAVPGTAQAFAEIQKARPDIFLVACEAHEDPEEIAPVADLVIMTDFVARGYLIVYSAKELGAENFAHISFPRHLDSSVIRRRRDVMREACRDLGLNFYEIEGPDPTDEAIGVEGAQKIVEDSFPEWLRRYGPRAAFFTTNDAHILPLVGRVAELGGVFLEGDIPSPILGFPEVFGVNPDDYNGDWPSFVRELERRAVARGAGGRLGTWVYPVGFNQSAGAAEYGRLLARGEARVGETQDLLDAFRLFSPEADWSGSFYMDELTGKPIRNYFLVYQDTYVLGRGYLNLPRLEVPLKYLVWGTASEGLGDTGLDIDVFHRDRGEEAIF